MTSTRSVSGSVTSHGSGTRLISVVSVRPRVVGGDVEVAGDGVAAAGVGVAAGHELALPVDRGAGDHEVLLAALAAEAQGQQRLVGVPGHADLVAAGDVAGVLGLQGHVDGVALGEELVEAEREDRPLARRVGDRRPLAQDVAQCRGAGRLVEAGQLGQRLGGLGQRGGRSADQSLPAVRRGLVGQAERRLDPAGQRVADERVERALLLAVVGAHRVGQRRTVGVDVRGGAHQRLPHHVLGPDLGAEEAGRDAGHHASTVLERALARHRGAGADELEVVGLALVAQAADQHRHVRALPAAVGVQLVQRQEPQPLRGPNQLVALVRTRQHQVEHHVVRQQDVRRVREDPAPLVRALLAGVAGERDRLAALGIAELQELPQLLDLGVGQRVHRVDDDRLHPGTTAAPRRRSRGAPRRRSGRCRPATCPSRCRW